MRCPFCHNPSLVFLDDVLEKISEDEFFYFLEKRKGVLDGVCITGGEALFSDISDFIKKIKEKGFAVKLDTNGSFPEKLSKLLEENLLDYVAMDFKNTYEKYPQTVGIKNFNTTPIKKSVSLLIEYSKRKDVIVEFRTTLIKSFHTEKDLIEIAEMTKEAKFSIQKFKNNEPLIGDRFQTHLEKFSEEEYEKILKKIKTIHPSVIIKG